jgi:hypothetical protein
MNQFSCFLLYNKIKKNQFKIYNPSNKFYKLTKIELFFFLSIHT